jgi:hypothetical protein
VESRNILLAYTIPGVTFSLAGQTADGQIGNYRGQRARQSDRASKEPSGPLPSWAPDDVIDPLPEVLQA